MKQVLIHQKNFIHWLSLLAVSSLAIAANVCEIGVGQNFSPYQPLLKVLGANRLLLPDTSDGKIIIAKNEKIDVCCPEFCEKQKCIGGNKFETSDGTTVNAPGDWVCRSRSSGMTSKFKPEIKQLQQSCLSKGVWLTAGLEYDTNKFLELYRVCFDMTASTPLLVVHDLDKHNINGQANVDCPSTWQHSGYFGTVSNPNAKYEKVNAHATIAAQLGGSTAAADRIVQAKSDTHYLAKGHMAPKGDFVFAPEKLSTCSLVNAVPQFQTINNGQWKSLENKILTYIKQNPSAKLTFYTGSFGVLTVNGTPLYLSQENPKKIPIPKAMYKIISIGPGQEYYVYIAINNNFDSKAELEKKANNYVICDDICNDNKVKGFFPCASARTPESGYVYACEINSFMTALKQTYGINLSDAINLGPYSYRPSTMRQKQ